MPVNSFTLFAPSKLNLFLHVVGKQPDGYHLLQSLVAFLDVGDEIEFTEHDSLFIDVQGPFADELTDLRENLVYKAAVLLAEEGHVPLKGKIVLKKNLPVSSGIGGGSSDAATTLLGLTRLWHMQMEPAYMEDMARKLGADVTACLYRKFIWIEGIGDKIMRVPDAPDLHFALVNPLVPTLTAEVFAHLRRRPSAPLQYSGRRRSTAAWIADLKLYNNDLTGAAIAVTPEIRGVLEEIAQTPGCLIHRLSGSGATCFGIYETAEAAETAAQMLKTAHPEWWVEKAGMIK